MAINRATRKETFAYLLEVCAILGVLGGAGLGVFDEWGGTPPQLVFNAMQFGFFGFIGGTVVGIVLGTIAVVFATIFR